MNILALETSTNYCSVALSLSDGVMVCREENGVNIHSSRLNILIMDILAESGLKPDQIELIAVSKGPGSYTGLRIGVSTAKGLCFALNKPLVGINTLQIMVADAVEEIKSETSQDNRQLLYCPMIDARRMEVYYAVFDSEGHFVKETKAEIVDDNFNSGLLSEHQIVYFGNGSAKCIEILKKNPNATVLQHEIFPRAYSMISLARKRYLKGDMEDIVSFEPYYLKDFYTTAKKL